MADYSLLGLFHETEATADTVEQLQALDIPDTNISILSGMPYRAEMFGLPQPRIRVVLIALIGAVLGLLTGGFLSAGIFLLYPLVQGYQPIVPVPPTLIVLFEATMLGTMWATFFGLLGENRFPVFRKQVYDHRITEGHIGLLAELDESLLDKAEEILKNNGAHHIKREINEHKPDILLTAFWASVGLAIAVLAALILLVAYDVIKFPFQTNMANQISVASLQGPRLAPPSAAVPIQGPVLIDGQPASEPLPATPESLQRGQILFHTICIMCHGESGQGNGPLSSFFTPGPANLTSAAVQDLPPQTIFLVITEGKGIMPSMAENLSPSERWDVINHVLSLNK